MKKLNNKGFSLVELIIVIAIMVVLVGILAPQFIKYVESSRQSTDLQNLEQLKTAIEVLATEKGFTSATITINDGTTPDGMIKVGSISPSSLSLDTVANEVKLKSSGWGTTTFTYSSNTWTGTDLTNSNDPGRSTAGVFGR